ncbi:hypothetical protein PUN28_000946 [Cardiocondyla obscurior]|uniref:Uncharacterized protein n=1 Tax=Cardiocondyla obscurior TaxID=286306 RepID=A0AAW2H1Y4_9HYME
MTVPRNCEIGFHNFVRTCRIIFKSPWHSYRVNDHKRRKIDARIKELKREKKKKERKQVIDSPSVARSRKTIDASRRRGRYAHIRREKRAQSESHLITRLRWSALISIQFIFQRSIIYVS